MKCKKCGFDWQPHGEQLICPNCGESAAMTHTEQQALWNEANNAQKIKDYTLRANCYLRLAEQGDRKAEYAYAECLSEGVGVAENKEEALLWYKAAAGKMHPGAAYRLAVCLRDKRFGNNESQVLFWMRVAAEFGDTDAAYELYRMYEDGEGTAPSHRHALYWLRQSAKGGNEQALVDLASMYAVGQGVEQDLSAARYFMSKIESPTFRQRRFIRKLGKGEAEEPSEILLPTAAEERLELGSRAEAEAEYAVAANIYYLGAKMGDARANYLLGGCYEKGNGVPKSDAEARRRFGMSSDRGCLDATIRLGDYAKDGIGGEKDASFAIACYRKAAEEGSAQGAYLLAEAYRRDELIKSNLSEALRYYEIAAKRGHEQAKEEAKNIRDAISVVFEKGLAAEREQDYNKSIHFFSLAAGMGHAGACCRLGVMYEEGRGCDPDMKTAVSYYRTAAEQGNLGGVYRLGVCYCEGRGVAHDYRLAVKLLSVAAKQGYGDATALVEKMRRRKHEKAGQKIYSISSILYRRGDVAEAIRFRTIAAKLGNARAMYLLGCHFEFGDGLPADREKASAWYTRASRAGFSTRAGSDLKGGFLRERKQLLLRRKNMNG